MALLDEFKSFAIKGNMIDLAVGVIIGAAFGKIVESLVKDMLMPLLGRAIGGVDFHRLFINLGSDNYATFEAAERAGAPMLKYGVFLNATIDFLILAWIVFLMVKAINHMKSAAPPPPPAAPPEDVLLLREIRDALNKQ